MHFFSLISQFESLLFLSFSSSCLSSLDCTLPLFLFLPLHSFLHPSHFFPPLRPLISTSDHTSIFSSTVSSSPLLSSFLLSSPHLSSLLLFLLHPPLLWSYLFTLLDANFNLYPSSISSRLPISTSIPSRSLLTPWFFLSSFRSPFCWLRSTIDSLPWSLLHCMFSITLFYVLPFSLPLSLFSIPFFLYSLFSFLFSLCTSTLLFWICTPSHFFLFSLSHYSRPSDISPFLFLSTRILLFYSHFSSLLIIILCSYIWSASIFFCIFSILPLSLLLLSYLTTLLSSPWQLFDWDLFYFSYHFSLLSF